MNHAGGNVAEPDTRRGIHSVTIARDGTVCNAARDATTLVDAPCC